MIPQPRPIPYRDHRFDGSVNRKGLSQLMIAVSLNLRSQIAKAETQTRLSRDNERFKIIIEEVSFIMQISDEHIRSVSRKKYHVIARSITLFVSRYVTNLSLNELGKLISINNPKDHSTVIHACNRFMNLYEAQDEAFENAYEPIKELLHSKHGITVNFNDVLHQPLWFQKMMAERKS